VAVTPLWLRQIICGVRGHRIADYGVCSRCGHIAMDHRRTLCRERIERARESIKALDNELKSLISEGE
jgi:hypothetical protein